MSLLARSLRLVVSALSLYLIPAQALAEQAPQYVIISFDGAFHIEQWERSRALAKRAGASFTYFLSCTYLLSPDTRTKYQGPGKRPGNTNIGGGISIEDVRQRLDQIWQARGEGHEMASHGCGHFDGGEWNVEQWTKELDQFQHILENAWRINGLDKEPDGWRDLAQQSLGFRAPYLSTSPALFAALANKGFLYDASTVSNQPSLPVAKKGLIRFSLPLIPEGPAHKKIIAMDYNLYARHSGAKDDPSRAELFEERAYDAFKAALERERTGERNPLQLGFHFTLMNDGAYWRALERFAEEACGKPDVRCVSYRDYLDAAATVTASRLRATIGG